MKLKRETKIGIIGVITIAMSFWGLNFLRGKNVFSRTSEYHAIYKNISGLSESSPILVNGYKIGDIYSIKILPEHNNSILVSFDIDKKHPIPKNTIAEIHSTDFMGSKAIKLIFPNSVSEYLEEGDTLQSSIDEGMTQAINEIKSKTENTITALDSVITSIHYVFDKNLENNLQEIVGNLADITNAFKRQLAVNGELTKIMQNIATISDSIKAQSHYINETIENISVITDSISNAPVQSSIANLNLTLSNINLLLEGINSGEGSLGQLAKNDSLYTNLSNLTRDLDLLIKDLNEHPKKYVHFSLFGKKEK